MGLVAFLQQAFPLKVHRPLVCFSVRFGLCSLPLWDLQERGWFSLNHDGFVLPDEHVEARVACVMVPVQLMQCNHPAAWWFHVGEMSVVHALDAFEDALNKPVDMAWLCECFPSEQLVAVQTAQLADVRRYHLLGGRINPVRAVVTDAQPNGARCLIMKLAY